MSLSVETGPARPPVAVTSPTTTSSETISAGTTAPEPGSPPSLVPTLAGGYYTEDAQHELDQRRIFARQWQCVGRADAVQAAGDFVRAEVGGESVIVLRGRDGAARAFRNLCRHRGALLCAQESGSVGKALRCMYHAWTYGLDGRLLSAPNLADMPGMDRSAYGLHPVHLTQWLGYLWVNLDAQPPPLAAQVEPQVAARFASTQTLDRYGIEDLRVARAITYDVASNWKSLVENFMECYHCATIHPELTEALPQFASGYGSISAGAGSGATFAQDMDAFSLSGSGNRPRLPGLLPEDDRLFYGVVLRPNVFLVLVPDHVAVFRMEPQAAGRTRVVVDWLFHPDVMAGSGFDPSDAVALLDVTNRQDFEACERCQLGMRSPAYRGWLVPAEHLVTEFYDWYLAAVSDPQDATEHPPRGADR